MLDLDFGEWIAGKDLTIDHLDGQLGGMFKPFAWPPARKARRS